MTVVARKNANSYCIDEIEVSKDEYSQFLKAGVKDDGQGLRMQASDEYEVCSSERVARTESPPGTEGPGTPFAPGVGKAFNFALPVHYVDWCDAAAYCTWAKKQLCGSTSGGPVEFSKAASDADDAWYNACSSSGDVVYPYSVATFDPARCNAGQGIGTASDASHAGPVAIQGRSGYGAAANQDEGLLATTNGDVSGNDTLVYGASCEGGFTGLYPMAGNVAEWEHSCDGAGATATCRVRGGSFLSGINNAAALRCDNLSRTEARVPPESDNERLRDVGIRCCYF